MKPGFGGAWIVLVAGCSIAPRPLHRYEFVESHMATPCRIVLYAETKEQAERAARAGYAEMAAVDAAMNDYQPGSEISRLSRASGGGPVRISDGLLEVLDASLRFSRVSGGAFDVTVGPAVRLWREARKDRKLPAPEKLQEAASRVGWRFLHVDPVARTARLEKPGMVLDVGGIAKGYACDRALAALARQGITRALVDTGGGMVLGDPPPDAAGWKIQLADERGKVLVLSRCGVATSGDWERFVEIDGVRYSHLVDPKTGLGLTRRELVTVIAPDGMSSDALTKAVAIHGPDAGLKLAEDLPSVEAWMRWEDAGGIHRVQTSGFPLK